MSLIKKLTFYWWADQSSKGIIYISYKAIEETNFTAYILFYFLILYE